MVKKVLEQCWQDPPYQGKGPHMEYLTLGDPPLRQGNLPKP